MAAKSAVDIELLLRAPGSYALAAKALAGMQAAGVWPTALNFELWLHVAADPAGPLGREIDALRLSDEPITEARSEEIAARHLPRGQLSEQIRDAGQHLDTQLEQVALAIGSAQRTNAAYGRTLAGVTRELADDAPVRDVRVIIDGLASATRRVQRDNGALEKRLNTSTQEVARLREHLDNARREAMTDALSDLPNRKAFDEGLARACERAEAANEPLTLAVIDIDHFKRFNDTWGHQTGDQVIRFVASVIRKHGAPPRLPARYGGEEFALVLPKFYEAPAVQVLEQVRFEIGSRSLKRRSTEEDLGAVTVSVGLAERRPGEPISSLLERADAALYASKRGGRDCVTAADMKASVAA